MNPGSNNQPVAAPVTPDPLAALRDIHLPADPGWWPPAPGWWLLLLLVALGSFWACRAFYRWWWRQAPYRQYRRALLAIDISEDPPRVALASMSGLTRQFVISIYGRERTASLNGNRWLSLLDRHAGRQAFTNGPGTILGSGPYSTAQPDRETLLRLRQSLLELTRRRARPEAVLE